MLRAFRSKPRLQAATAALVLGAATAACQVLGGFADIVYDDADADAGYDLEAGVIGPDGGDASVESGLAADALGDLPLCGDASRCVPRVPVGWTGPVALYEGPSDRALPYCASDASPYVGKTALDVGLSSCASCACDSPTGRTCNVATTRPFAGASCGLGTECAQAQLDLGQCTALDTLTCANAQSMRVAGFQPTGGSCYAREQGQSQLPPPVWGRAAVGCGATVGNPEGCATSENCVDVPAPPYAGTLCIMLAGQDAPCPPGAFTDRHVYYGDHADGRKCSACTCGSPEGGTCSGGAGMSVTFFSGAGCTNQLSSGSASGCIGIPAGAGVARISGPAPSVLGGGCAASGGDVEGGVTPANPTTFCCLP